MEVRPEKRTKIVQGMRNEKDEENQGVLKEVLLDLDAVKTNTEEEEMIEEDAEDDIAVILAQVAIAEY